MITGANKGIGLATVRAVLERDEDACVLLGARDAARGQAARNTLVAERDDWAERLHTLQIDVSDQRSVVAARDTVERQLTAGAGQLYGLVNNAGIGLGSSNLREVLEVNTLGPKRVCDAFISLLAPAGRLVNVSSASGPNFVSQCSGDRQRFFKDATLQWTDVEELIGEVLACEGDAGAAQALGLGDMNAYGFSKACLSLYTLLLARDHPQLIINACTPGYIATDLTRPRAEAEGVAPAELGMKSPAEGTRATMFLLFGENCGTGHYFGSDAKRSPLDRYRAPGSPEYTGD